MKKIIFRVLSVALPIITVLVLYFYTRQTNIDDSGRLLIVATLMSFLISFVVGIVFKLWDATSAIDSIESELSKINQKADNLVNIECKKNQITKLELTESEYSILLEMAESFALTRDIHKSHTGLRPILDWKKSNLSKNINDLKNSLSSQKIVIDEPNKEWVSNNELLKSLPKKSVKAVSIEDNEFWKSASGDTFLKTHLELIKKNVSITRVFVGTSEELEKSKDVIQQQADIGVHVYALDSSCLSGARPNDMVLYDDKYIRTGIAQDYISSQYRHAVITISSSEVQRGLDTFNMLLENSVKVEAQRKK